MSHSINSFSASPSSVVSGGSSTLSWMTTGASSVALTAFPEGGSAIAYGLQALDGSRVFAPTVTTEYRLQASTSVHPGVFLDSYVTVTVTEPDPVVTSNTDSTYRLDTSTPATPTGGTSTDNHVPSGWTNTNPDATATENVYRARRTEYFEDGAFDYATSWGSVTKIKDATGVTTTDTDYVYRLAATTPSTPTGGTSTLDHQPTGWSRTEPDPEVGMDVWRASRTETFLGGVFQSATVWGSVTKIADAIAVTTDTDSVYRLAVSEPAAPTGGTTTDIYTPVGWSRVTLTATGNEGVYRSQRTRTYHDGVFQGATEWGAVVLTQEPPTATDTDYVYRLSGVTPSTPQGGVADETHTPAEWHRVDLDPTTAQGVYRASRTRTYNGDVFASATTWGGVELYRTADTDYVYRLSVLSPAVPTGGTDVTFHIPAGWQRTEPDPTAVRGVYSVERTRNYRLGAFQSATVWGTLTLVAAAEPIVTTDTDYIFRLASVEPNAPGGGTGVEVHTPSNWSRTEPAPTETKHVYRAQRTRSYSNGAFVSATAWDNVIAVSDLLPPPTINSFMTDRAAIAFGESTTLRWTTTDADYVTIIES